ncbi:hypothetical protein OGATHE_004917 [Ogataea polymorpha]|uniref:Uncharacterized protein n=1 Tax=Ogataea polymorpha TaxID=460523 RepID=A0A9P8NVQ9_9ASCO|nr:hypothetical protein OGATHE_004917 [Ogataea polymorpha]
MDHLVVRNHQARHPAQKVGVEAKIVLGYVKSTLQKDFAAQSTAEIVKKPLVVRDVLEQLVELDIPRQRSAVDEAVLVDRFDAPDGRGRSGMAIAEVRSDEVVLITSYALSSGRRGISTESLCFGSGVDTDETDEAWLRALWESSNESEALFVGVGLADSCASSISTKGPRSMAIGCGCITATN